MIPAGAVIRARAVVALVAPVVVALVALAVLVGLPADSADPAWAAAFPDSPQALLVQPVPAPPADLGFKDLDGRDVVAAP